MSEKRVISAQVDGYTRVCLTVIAVLLTLLVIGLWGRAVPDASRAHAAEAFLDTSAQRQGMTDAQKQTNATLAELVALFKTGQAKVQVQQAAEEKPGKARDANAPAIQDHK